MKLHNHPIRCSIFLKFMRLIRYRRTEVNTKPATNARYTCSIVCMSVVHWIEMAFFGINVKNTCNSSPLTQKQRITGSMVVVHSSSIVVCTFTTKRETNKHMGLVRICVSLYWFKRMSSSTIILWYIQQRMRCVEKPTDVDISSVSSYISPCR